MERSEKKEKEESIEDCGKSFVRLLDFHEVCKGILKDLGFEMLVWSEEASKVLLTVTQDYFVGIFEDSNSCAEHCRRITLQIRDVQLARKIRSRFECIVGSKKVI